MAEQAHFAKYKISLKNNNKESQQVNENIRVRNSKIRFLENSRIQEFVEVDRQKKEEKLLKFLLLSVIQSRILLRFRILSPSQLLNTINPKVGLGAFFLIVKCQTAHRANAKAAVGAVVDIHIIIWA